MKRALLLLACLTASLAAPYRAQSGSATAQSGRWFGAKQNPRTFDPRQTKAQAEAIAAQQPLFNRVSIGAVPGEWLVPPLDPYRVGPGDRLEIELLGFPETKQMCMVLPDGTMLFHTCDPLKVTGMTIEEVQAAIQKALSVDYRKPQIAIIVREANNRRVWIMGRCKQPGVYTMEGPTTVLDILGRAGGFEVARSLGDSEELVDLQHSFLIRNGRVVPIDFNRLVRDGDTRQNIYLKNDDYIYLPAGSGSRAFVLGGVMQPRVVDFREHMTLTAAISNAGGFARGSYPEHVMLVRDSLASPKVAVVNVNAIIRGKAADVALEPRDIIWVPNAPWQRLEAYVGEIISAFARTVAANEGARAASPTAPGVGLSLGIGSGSSTSNSGPAQNAQPTGIGTEN